MNIVFETNRLLGLGVLVGLVVVLISLGTGALLKKLEHERIASIFFGLAMLIPLMVIGVANFLPSNGWYLSPGIWSPTKDAGLYWCIFMLHSSVLGLYGLRECS